jgi:Plasmid encoded RepA protein
MTDSTDWHPGHQLQLWGVEGAQARAEALGATKGERKKLKERLNVAHGMLSALPSAEDLSFLHSGLCQIGLPHSRPPSNQTIWARRSGRLSLLIKPGVYDNRAPTSRGARPTPEEQEAMFVGLPYGARARLILIFLQGEAVARGREVALGESLSAWMRSLGIAPSSGPRGAVASVREQALRIGLCSFTVQWDGLDAAGNQVISLRDVPIVEGLDLAAKPGVAGIWPRSVFLGQAFYEHLREHAVPLDKRAVAHLAGNSLGLDLYALFAYRLPRLKADLALRWADLAEQLGAGDTSMSSFGQRVREVLPDVLAGYPEAKIEVTKHGLTLRPSQPSVPRTAVNGFRLVGG